MTQEQRHESLAATISILIDHCHSMVDEGCELDPIEMVDCVLDAMRETFLEGKMVSVGLNATELDGVGRN